MIVPLTDVLLRADISEAESYAVTTAAFVNAELYAVLAVQLTAYAKHNRIIQMGETYCQIEKKWMPREL